MPSIKYKTNTGSFETALAGLADLEELASECREIVDNATEGLAQTQRIQTMSETADALENIETAVDIPDSLTDEVVSWTEAYPSRKGRSLSRSNRRNNAIAGAQQVIDACRAISDDVEEPEEPTREDGESEADYDKRHDEWADEQQEWQTRHDDAEELADTLEGIVNEVEGLEFPGMYG